MYTNAGTALDSRNDVAGFLLARLGQCLLSLEVMIKGFFYILSQVANFL